MKILIIYGHPSKNSFTYLVKESFIKGLTDAGHSFELSDLYEMKFNETFKEQEYIREAFYNDSLPVAEDVLEEQRKINEADMIAFIYPVFWTEAPEKMVGWFQRVWTYGFAYGPKARMKQLEKAIFLVTMGGSLQDEIRRKQVDAMKTVMLGDRINERAKEKIMFIFDEMTRDSDNADNWEKRSKKFQKEAYQIGYKL